jgi:clan AA aspartic protease (TIGR02281 family)
VIRCRPGGSALPAAPTGREILLILLGAAQLLAARPLCAADVVHLVNGRTMEGVLREETDLHVVLDVGVGSVQLARSAILRIERAQAGEAARLREDWQRKHWLHPKFVPAGLEKLAAAARQLTDQRRTVARSTPANATETDAARRDREREQQLHQRMAEVAQAIESIDPLQARDLYNARVAESHRIRAELSLLADQARTRAAARTAAAQRTRAYRDALLACRAETEKQRAALAGTTDPDAARSFLERLAQRLDQLEGDFTLTEIETENEGGALIVTVAVNGKAHGRFVLDTGAAMVTLTEEFADKLGLAWRSLPVAQARMADGSMAEARYLTLASLRLGPAEAGHVQAAVLSSAGPRDTDGLLGMSFLNRFDMHLDGAAGRIVLREFKAGPGNH